MSRINGQEVRCCWLPERLGKSSSQSDQDAYAGSLPEIERIIRQILQTWPKVRIILRGDCGFCRNGIDEQV